MRIKVKVTPNASKNKIIGWVNDTLKIKIASPAQKGKANKEYSMVDFRINRHVSIEDFVCCPQYLLPNRVSVQTLKVSLPCAYLKSSIRKGSIAFYMPRMCTPWIAPPIDDDVCPMPELP